MTRWRWLPVLVLAACGGGDVKGTGTEGGPCGAGGACNPGLACASQLCVNVSPLLDVPADGTSDAAQESSPDVAPPVDADATAFEPGQQDVVVPDLGLPDLALDPASDPSPDPVPDPEPDPAPDCAGDECAATPPCPAGFSLIPAGEFDMGSPADEYLRGQDETLHHAVLTKPFCLKQTEVTQAEWQAVTGNNPSEFSACGGDCPVEYVRWYDALAYCNALSLKESLTPCYALSICGGIPGSGTFDCQASAMLDSCTGYRLPTEAEWEYAARAGTTTATYNGTLTAAAMDCPAMDVVLNPIAWFNCNSQATYPFAESCAGGSLPGKCGTQPVRGKLPNEWGLCDMLGNVMEWCWDAYGDYPTGTAIDPAVASSPPWEKNHVLRGGSWDMGNDLVRAAARYRNNSSEVFGDTGFRIARAVAP